MALDKYTIQHKSVSNLLSLIDMKKIAIPEIQRPFVWSSTQVRDLMDSLYRGFPVGYIISWQNPDVRLKDGSDSRGKIVIIDGQQRITALRAALDGQLVMSKDYAEIPIRIAFNPITEQFDTSTPAYKNNKEWISDISEIMKDEFDLYKFIEKYIELNPDTDKSLISDRIRELLDIKTRTIGELEINSEVNISVVNEIFIRINKKGVKLSEADFAMSQIAVYEQEEGDECGVFLRKTFDYFCHLLKQPLDSIKIENNDKEFSQSDDFKKIKWLAKADNMIYKPTYSDIIRVAGIIGLNRARLRDVVALLAGRNFEVRSFNRPDSYMKTIADDSFTKFKTAIDKIVNEYNYKRFHQDILFGIGLKFDSMISSINAINYAFSIYQKLLNLGARYNDVRRLTRKFLVMTLLTERHSGSFESTWVKDFKSFNSIAEVQELLNNIEQEQLNDIFWTITLPRAMRKKTASSNTVEWNLYVAAQIKFRKQSFLNDVPVSEATILDLHHIFPQEYMLSQGKDRYDYNKIGNFVALSKDINIKIGKTPPNEYLINYKNYGSNITDLENNLRENCLPTDLELWKIENYEEFLNYRTNKIAELIKKYYEKL